MWALNQDLNEDWPQIRPGPEQDQSTWTDRFSKELPEPVRRAACDSENVHKPDLAPSGGGSSEAQKDGSDVLAMFTTDRLSQENDSTNLLQDCFPRFSYQK